MIQHALRLIKMGIEQGLKRKFGTDSLTLLSDVRKIANVQQLKKILHALSEVSSADDLRKLIQGPQALTEQPPPAAEPRT